jgi:DNA helicase-2/ATP-dependent DNA helicase PcrA
MYKTDILSSYLTKEQHEAIIHKDGPLLIIAGPGAGKTDVIVRRTAYLVREHSIDPKNLLVTTFTNKAANELYDRLWPYLGNQSHDIHISTIHSFCQKLLSDYSDSHHWGRTFDILDDRDQFLFVYARLRDLGLNRFPKGRMGDFLADVISTFNLCTEEMVDPEKFKQEIESRGTVLLGLKKDNPEAIEEYMAIANAYECYLELLQGEGLIDFGMLQKITYEMLLSVKNVRDEVAKQFKYILVDEYQDTNRLQVLLLKEIAHPNYNICAVGDDDQSIYRFRGSTVKSFLKFEKDITNPKIVTLNVNFRATPSLVKISEKLIKHNESFRREKDIEAHRQSPVYQPIWIHAETCTEEAELVVKSIIEARKNGFIEDYGDVAFLFRSVKYHAQDYLEALERYKVPFRVVSDGGFFDREDIINLKELITFCGWKEKWDPRIFEGKLLELHPDTIEAIRKIKEDPSTWVDKEFLFKLGVHNQEDLLALKELANIRVQTQNDEVTSLLDLFYELLRVTGYFKRSCKQGIEGKKSSEANAALLNLAQFSALINSFQKLVRTQNTYRFGDYLRTIPSRSLDALRPDPEEEAALIMTIHQAKGLEYPLVVIGSLMEGRFPGRFRPPKYPIPSELRLSNESDSKEENIRDQRRLFYVGITRAENLLIIGSADKVNKRGGGRSSFIEDIGEDQFAESSLLRTEKNKFEKRIKKPSPVRQRLSYSAVHIYMLCPLQYKLLFDCGFAVPQAHLFQFGRLIHQALEILHNRALKGDKITTATARLVLDKIWKPFRYWKPEQESGLKESGYYYLTRYCEAYSDRFHRIHWVEEPIDLSIGDGVVISGKIDLACKTEKGIEVIDFKVRSRRGFEILKPHLQVKTYGLACCRQKDLKIEQVVIHLLAEEPGRDLEIVQWNEEVAKEANKTIHDAIAGIQSKLFDPIPGAHCNYCDFSDICPSSETRKIIENTLKEEPTIGAMF